jgi:hypothetical protein
MTGGYKHGGHMKNKTISFRMNALLARQMWGQISSAAMQSLKELTTSHLALLTSSRKGSHASGDRD